MDPQWRAFWTRRNQDNRPKNEAAFWKAVAVGLRCECEVNRDLHFKGMRESTAAVLGPGWVSLMDRARQRFPVSRAKELHGISLLAAQTTVRKELGGRPSAPFAPTLSHLDGPAYAATPMRAARRGLGTVPTTPAGRYRSDPFDDDWWDGEDGEDEDTTARPSPTPKARQPEPEGATSTRAAAYHEAGHAVAAYAVYGPKAVRRVSIQGGGGGLTELRVPESGRHAIHVLAGPLAEARAKGGATGHGGDLRILSELEVGAGPAERRYNRDEAARVVEENWPAIVAVADALVRQRSLTGAQLGQVIADARFQAAYRGEGW